MSRKIHVLAGSTVYTYDDSGAQIATTSASSGSAVAANPANDNELYFSSGDTLWRASIGGSINGGHQPGETIKDIAVSEDFLYILHGGEVTQIDHTDIGNPVRTIRLSFLTDPACIAAYEGGIVVGGTHRDFGVGWVQENTDTSDTTINDWYANGPGQVTKIDVSPNGDWIILGGPGGASTVYDATRSIAFDFTDPYIQNGDGSVANDGTGLAADAEAGGRFNSAGIIENNNAAYGGAGDFGCFASFEDADYYATGSVFGITPVEVAEVDKTGTVVWSATLPDDPRSISVHDYVAAAPTEGDWTHTEATTNPEPTTYSITGQVSEAGQQVSNNIVGAAVTLRNGAGDIEATTQTSVGGNYSFSVDRLDDDLPETFTVEVEADGYQDASDTVAVDVGTTSYTLNIAIEAESTEGAWAHTEATTHSGIGDWTHTETTTHSGFGDWTHTEATTHSGLGEWAFAESTTQDGIGGWQHTQATTDPLPPLSPYADAVVASGPVFYAPLEEDLTSLIGAQDFYVENGTPSIEAVSDPDYPFDAALETSSTSWARADLVASQLNIDGGKPRTVEVWTRGDVFDDNSGPWSLGAPGNDGEDFAIRVTNTSGEWRFQFWGGADIDVSLNNQGVWTHMVFTYDGSTGVVYIDGQQFTSQSVSLNTLDTEPLRVGLWPRREGDSGYAGGTSHLSIYDKVLTAQEIEDHYNAAFAVESGDWSHAEVTTHNGVGDWAHSQVTSHDGVGSWAHTEVVTHSGIGAWAHTETTTHNGLGQWAFSQITTHNGEGTWAFSQTSTHNGEGAWAHSEVTTHDGIGDWSHASITTEPGEGAWTNTEATTDNGIGSWTDAETSTTVGQGVWNSTETSTNIGEGSWAFSQTSTAIGEGTWASAETATGAGEGVWASAEVTTDLAPGEAGEWASATALTLNDKGAWASTGVTTDIGEGAWANAQTSTGSGQGVWANAQTSTDIGEGMWASEETTTADGVGSWVDTEATTDVGEGAWASTERATDLAPGEAGDWASAETTTLNDKGVWASAESTTDIGEGSWASTPITTDTGIGEWGNVEVTTADGTGTWSSSEVTTGDGIGDWASSETQTDTGIGSWASSEATTSDGIGSWASTEATTQDGIGAWASAGVTTQDGIGSWANVGATTDTGIGAWSSAEATTKAVGQWASTITVTDPGLTAQSGYRVGPLRVSARHLRHLPQAPRQPHLYTEMITLHAQTDDAQNDFGEVVATEQLVYEGDAQVDDKGLASEHLSGSALQDKELIYAYLPVAEMPERLKTGDRLVWEGQDYTIHKLVKLSSLVIAVK